MTGFDRGDVVLVAFPFTDLSTTKARPALVVSSRSFHRSGLDVVLAGITSKPENKTSFSDIPLSPEDQRHAGLPKPSLVRLGKIVTLDRRLIRKKLGRVPEPTLSDPTHILHRLLSEDRPKEGNLNAQETPARYRATKRRPVRKHRRRK